MTQPTFTKPPISDEEIEVADRFVEAASALWWLYLIAGIVSVAFGAVVLSFEFATAYALAVFVGAYFIGWGIVQLIAASRRSGAPMWLYIAGGLVSVAVGVLALFWPNATLFVIAVFIGWLLVIWGVFDVVGSFFITHQKFWWLYLIRGLLAAALGVWALAHPAPTIVVLVTVVGIMAILFGIIETVASFQMRTLDKRWEREKQSWRRASTPVIDAELSGGSDDVPADDRPEAALPETPS